MEAKRVFVENLPKPKKWWQEYTSIISLISVIIAVVAVSVALYSASLSRKEFIAAHRPYVRGISRRTTKDGRPAMDLNTVLLTCFNAPAKIINQEFYYVAVKTKENGEENPEIRYEKKVLDKHILYPTDIPTSQWTITYDFKKEILAKDQNIKLKRKIRIDYKELSSDRTYYFEGNWDYNRKYNVWETNNMFGD